MKKTATFLLTVLLISLAILIPMGSGLFAQCYGSLMLSPDIIDFDYLVRLCVHFGDIGSLPDGIQCCRSRLPGETPIMVPIFTYNLHIGLKGLQFAIESNDSIAAFHPENCFRIIMQSSSSSSGIYWYNLKLDACQPICGPALVGYAEIIPVSGADPIWVDLVPNRQTERMNAHDHYGEYHYLFSPHHGGYVGGGFLYACQRPICEEPNIAVSNLVATARQGRSVELTWVAGSGNHTLIRYSLDHFPTGLGDGEYVVEMESAPGGSQYYFHTGAPDRALLYYTAFSLTYDAADNVIRDSFIECSSSDTTLTNGQIAVKISSWGEIKKMLE